MNSRDIKMCTPEVQEKYHMLKNQCELAGLPFIVTRTSCTQTDQNLLFMQGRFPLAVVNAERAKYHYFPIVEVDNKIVTWTLDSKHVINEQHPYSDAFDIALISHNKPHWNTKISINDNEIPDYIEVANIGLTCGLIAGAFFKSKTTGKPTPDYCHFEI